jgi:hypothetical protein
MLTLREFYNEPQSKTGKDAKAATAQPTAEELEMEAVLIHGAMRLVAKMTEAHLTCKNRKCRGSRLCLGLNPDVSGGSCRAPMTQQRADMMMAIITFEAGLIGSWKYDNAMREQREQQKKAQPPANKLW